MRCLLLLLLTLAPALAQAPPEACRAELQGGLSAEALARAATGVEAAGLLARAVELLEPALPQLAHAPELPLAPTEAGYDDLRFLAERGLLPYPFDPAAPLTPELWRELLAGLWAWYAAAPSPPAGDLSVGGLVIDLARLIGAVGPDLRSVALVAAEPLERDRLAFVGLIRNASVYPRLVVQRPNPELSLALGVAAVLPHLSSCAETLTNYVYASTDTARRLFLAHNDARMYLVAARPEREFGGLQLVPSGEEASYLAFEAPALEPLAVYAAAFEGPRPSPAALLRLLPQVRTNMNPRELVQFLLTN